MIFIFGQLHAPAEAKTQAQVTNAPTLIGNRTSQPSFTVFKAEHAAALGVGDKVQNCTMCCSTARSIATGRVERLQLRQPSLCLIEDPPTTDLKFRGVGTKPESSL